MLMKTFVSFWMASDRGTVGSRKFDGAGAEVEGEDEDLDAMSVGLEDLRRSFVGGCEGG